jgi:hypothetical protein
MKTVLDETGDPSLREVLGTLLATAAHADLAVSRVHLSAIDLSAAEASGMGRCRFLLGRLEAAGLSGIGDGAERSHLRTLHELLRSGRVEIRSAGMGAWAPDFSVFRNIRGAGRLPFTNVCLIGAHYFHHPLSAVGPSLTCVLAEPHAVELAARRFADLWQRAHDVQPAVLHTVARLLDDAA